MKTYTSPLIKEARRVRRFDQGDSVRYVPDASRGTGKVVQVPRYRKGKVNSFDSDKKRYIVVDNDTEEHVEIHPRNMMFDGAPATKHIEPEVIEEPQKSVSDGVLPVSNRDDMMTFSPVEPFPR